MKMTRKIKLNGIRAIKADEVKKNKRKKPVKTIINETKKWQKDYDTITTKSRNKLGENEYLTTREDGLVEYFVLEIRKTNRTGKPIERKKQVNQLKQRKVSLLEARRIKVVLDEIQKR